MLLHIVIKILLVIIASQEISLVTRTPGSIAEAAQTPKLKLNVSHIAPDEVKYGSKINFTFAVTHDSQSTGNARQVQVRIFLPYILQNVKVLQQTPDAAVQIVNRTISFEISELKSSDVLNGQYQLQLPRAKKDVIPPGFHYAVTEIQVVWRAINADGNTGPQLSLPLQSYSVPLEVIGCSYDLGINSGLIKDYQLTASSSTPTSRPERVKYSDDGWCALHSAQNQYIQVLFAKKTRITKIITWARSRKGHWISKYTLQFSNDGYNWITYKENGIDKVFEGNKDTKDPAVNVLRYSIGFNFIRLLAQEWNIQVCLRLELFGCEVSRFENCVDPIGMQNGKIPDQALSDIKKDKVGPPNGRLYKRVTDFPFGWKADDILEDYYQVDLGSIHKITRIAIQGSDNEPSIFYVKTYKVMYSNNSLTWLPIKDGTKDKIFIGPDSGESGKYPTIENIAPAVYARLVRLIPISYTGAKVLRTEIYGCVSEPKPSNTTPRSIPFEFGRRTVLLDNKRNLFYVCIYREKWNQRSCFATSDGSTWEVINEVVNIIGYDDDNKALYGINNFMSYSLSRDSGVTWISISEEEWTRRQSVSKIVLATKLRDILVGDVPESQLTWKDSNGKTWGVSGKGIHLKGGDKWNLIANWKCCGF